MLNFTGFKKEKTSILDNIKKRNPNLNLEGISDLIKDIQAKKGEIDNKGIVTCYYALSKYNKKSYEKEGTVGAGSDKIMVSTTNNKDLKKYGDTILTLYIPIENLYFAASTKDAILLKIPFRSSYRKMNLKQYLKK